MRVIITEDREREELLRMAKRLYKVSSNSVEAVSRKRSWRPSERAMATAEYIRDREALRILLLALGENV